MMQARLDIVPALAVAVAVDGVTWRGCLGPGRANGRTIRWLCSGPWYNHLYLGKRASPRQNPMKMFLRGIRSYRGGNDDEA
jgi:hypothetical protein